MMDNMDCNVNKKAPAETGAHCPKGRKRGMMDNMLQKNVQPKNEVAVVSGYNTSAGFDLVQRVAKMFSASSLVPETYRGNIPNCVIALEMAQRIGSSPLMTMQNMYIVHGRPAWSSQFLIACLNASGRFSPLRYKETGVKGTESEGIVAWAKDLLDGETLEGPEVTIAMSKKEGWFQKNGSKWQTMPQLMLRYRAATFFARLYSPELTMGIRTAEEAADSVYADAEAGPAPYGVKMEDVQLDPALTADPAAVDAVSPDTDLSGEQKPNREPAQTAGMSKIECLAEIKTHEGATYYAQAMSCLPPECQPQQAPVSTLRGMVEELRANSKA